MVEGSLTTAGRRTSGGSMHRHFLTWREECITTLVRNVMKIEIWSDVVCPWCYIGKRHLEAALSQFDHADEVEITFRSFELDPEAPAQEDLPLDQLLARKYGMSVEEAQAANERLTTMAARAGLEYHLDRVKRGNSFDAHRMMHLAGRHGLQAEMKERLMRAYFTEGEAISDSKVLVRLSGELGIDDGEARDTLATGRFEDEVRADERAAGELGIRGVPCFVIERRWGISGAQPTEVFLQALGQSWEELQSPT